MYATVSTFRLQYSSEICFRRFCWRRIYVQFCPFVSLFFLCGKKRPPKNWTGNKTIVYNTYIRIVMDPCNSTLFPTIAVLCFDTRLKRGITFCVLGNKLRMACAGLKTNRQILRFIRRVPRRSSGNISMIIMLSTILSGGWSMLTFFRPQSTRHCMLR